jgi:hypothetical protein
MSRTKPDSNGPKNPATKFLQWKSSKKAWVYFDKEAKEEVVVAFNKVPFIVLDQLNTVKGFDRKAKQGMWSNEVRNVTKEEFTVRWKAGVVVEGLWNDIKGKESRIKFAKSIYVMAKIGAEYELANLQLTGGAMGAWFDFTKENDVNGDIVVGVESLAEDELNGDPIFAPKFSVIARELSDAASAEADLMDTMLQEYLTLYLGQAKEETEEVAPAAATTTPTYVPSNDGPDEPLDEPLDEEPPF